MKADPFQIGDVLKDQRRFVVPIYQRTYAWTPGRQLGPEPRTSYELPAAIAPTEI